MRSSSTAAPVPATTAIGSNRRHRLAGEAAFAGVFRGGRRLEARHLQLIAAPATGAPGRVGYVIGRQQLARAVDRNYVRRLLREAVRWRRPMIERFDIVLRLRGCCERATLPELALEVGELLDALISPTRR